MPNLGEVNFNWDSSYREAEYKRWKDNAELNFSENQKSEESKDAFLLSWLGGTRLTKI